MPGVDHPRSRLATVALLAFLAACGGSSTSPVQPQYQPQIANNPNDFSFQLTNVQDGTGQLIYLWQNSGTAASVDRSCASSAGAVSLTMKDGGARSSTRARSTA